MRKNLLHNGYKELTYEIREIVEIAKKAESFGKEIYWDNIGDPVAKGEKIPTWIKELLIDSLDDNKVFGYTHSKGVLKTREYLASRIKNLTPDDIIFFNGLGEAINKIYSSLNPSSRVLGPNPAYPTHSSAEAAKSGSDHLTYSLDPNNNWNPNLEEIENKIKYNPNVVAILVINPDNPTGAVFDREVLVGIIDIAKKYDLFVIFDEIYEKLHFDEDKKILLSDIIGNVPGISMKGISKEIPWPGARCGWIEIYNSDRDENFAKFINSIYISKMLEVCSTTLPQALIPSIYENKNFDIFLQSRIDEYKSKAKITTDVFSDIDSILYVEPKGAYYFSIVFNLDKININYTPEFFDNKISSYLNKQDFSEFRFDKKFCYLLLFYHGICLVPLSGFNSTYDGFRGTLLEKDIDKFKKALNNIKDFIIMYSK